MNVETLQLVIIAALSVSTILVTIIGIQLILLLKEVKIIVKRIRNVSDGFLTISNSIEKSIRDMATVTDVAKIVSTVFSKMLRHTKKNA